MGGTRQWRRSLCPCYLRWNGRLPIFISATPDEGEGKDGAVAA